MVLILICVLSNQEMFRWEKGAFMGHSSSLSPDMPLLSVNHEPFLNPTSRLICCPHHFKHMLRVWTQVEFWSCLCEPRCVWHLSAVKRSCSLDQGGQRRVQTLPQVLLTCSPCLAIPQHLVKASSPDPI